MKKILLFTIALTLLAVGAIQAQQANPIQLKASKHHACLGDVIRIDELSREENTVGRRWVFQDTIINGSAIGEQITVFRQFHFDTNPFFVELYRNVIDTIVTVIADTTFNTTIDTIVNTPGDTTFTSNTDTIIHVTTDSTYTARTDTAIAYDTIYVFIPKKMKMTGDSIACPGDSVDIRMGPTVAGLNYKWFEEQYDNGHPVAYGTRLKVKPYTNSAPYYLKITNDSGCVAWDSTRVYIMQSSLTTTPVDGRICLGQKAYLIAGMADHYEWESIPSDSSINNDSAKYSHGLTVSPQKTTIYAVTPYSSSGCPGNKIYATITVHPMPTPVIKLTPTVIDPESPTITLYNNAQGNISSIWSFGINDFAEGNVVQHTFSDFTYDSTEITLRSINNVGCIVDTAFRVAIQRFASWAPNIFTPNRSENNIFQIRTVNEVEYFGVQIFNREGQMVFQSEDPNFIWDGTNRGKDCPQGAYVYIARYRRAGTDIVAVKKGTVILIR